MTGIPEDIHRQAIALVMMEKDVPQSSAIANFVARAILVERERCVAVALVSIDSFEGTEEPSHVTRFIADAILKSPDHN